MRTLLSVGGTGHSSSKKERNSEVPQTLSIPMIAPNVNPKIQRALKFKVRQFSVIGELRTFSIPY
jgi:hypothetical protein